MKIIFVRFLTHEDVKIGISLNTFEESENCLPVDNVFLGFSTKLCSIKNWKMAPLTSNSP